MATLYPRVWLSINGAMIPCKNGQVSLKSKRSAATFSAEISITKSAEFGMDLAAWADYEPVDVELIMATAFGAADQTSMVTGQIDMPKINWDQMTVSISGRDKTAGLIETRRSQKFPNQKSADICSTIAQAHGLNPMVSTQGSDFAGKLYNDNDTAHLAIHRTDFEILSDLADREGARWYVSGKNLVFEPKGQSSGAFPVFWAPPDVTGPGASTVENFKAWRNMTAAKPHTVNVKSFHDKDGKQYNGSATADGVGDPINIDHHHSRKNQDQVDKLAMSRAMDAIRHDCNVSFEAPIDLTVTAQMQTEVSGTGTIYDQTYDIDQVDFAIGWQPGGLMSVQAKAAKSGRSVSQGGSSDGADSAPGDSGDGT